LPDAADDTVVGTLSLCVIPDERQAVAEMKRVLRPGGRLLLLDHVAAASRLARVLQWLLERITVPLAGEHLRRRPLMHVQAEGFQVERRERSKLGIVERLAAPKPADQHGDSPPQPSTLGLGAAYLGRVRSQAATTAKQPHAVLLGLLAAAIALGGMLTTAHWAQDRCADHACPGGTVALTAGSGEPRPQPTGEPCGQAPACGGGAAHTLGTSLANGVVALAGVALLGPDVPGRTLRPVTDRLPSAPLPSGLDHPPRLAS
jgi:hypothetical protein